MVLQPLVGAQRVQHVEEWAACRTRARCRCTRPAGTPRRRRATSGPVRAPRSSCRRRSRSPSGPHQARARARAAASSRQAKMRSPWPLGPRPVCRSIQPRRAQRRPCSCSTWRRSGGSRWARCRRRTGPRDGVLAARDGRLQRRFAVRGDDQLLPRGDRLGPAATRAARSSAPARRRPGFGGQRLAEVVEVAVQVDVLVRRAAPPGEAVGIQRVDVQHRHAGCAAGGVPRRRRSAARRCTPEPQKPSTPWQPLVISSSR
jgi:hypothetical protein